jgi:hypothetical protein
MTSEQLVNVFVYLLSINHYHIAQARISCISRAAADRVLFEQLEETIGV